MIYVKIFVLALSGLGCGVISAIGFAAFITWISILPRLADLTKTPHKIRIYEKSLAFGFIIGDFISLFPLHFPLPISFAQYLLLIPALLSGIFTGCLVGALTELLQTMPILSQYLPTENIIKYIILSVSIAKCAGTLIQFS